MAKIPFLTQDDIELHLALRERIRYRVTEANSYIAGTLITCIIAILFANQAMHNDVAQSMMMVCAAILAMACLLTWRNRIRVTRNAASLRTMDLRPLDEERLDEMFRAAKTNPDIMAYLKKWERSSREDFVIEDYIRCLGEDERESAHDTSFAPSPA
jgi:hypothetical protein